MNLFSVMYWYNMYQGPDNAGTLIECEPSGGDCHNITEKNGTECDPCLSTAHAKRTNREAPQLSADC
jgi:hypothetical protein